MTDALAKWAAALDTFDSIKHNFRAPGQVEKAVNSIALDERVLLFRGSDSDIVERLSPYDQVAGQCCLARALSCLSLSLDVCIAVLESGLQTTLCQQCTCMCICVYHTLEAFD